MNIIITAMSTQIVSMCSGAPNFGNTWGDYLFQPGTPEI